MITPFFKLTQDAEYVIIEIRASNANIRDTQIEFFERTFCFSSPPYFLRLYLTGEVRQDDGTTTKYDAENGTFTIQMLKQKKDETFPNLDMLSELIKPQRPTAGKLVEEIDETEILAEQKIPEEEQPTDEKLKEFGYGFGWQRCDVLEKFGEELNEIFDLAQTETKINDRIRELETKDGDSFSSEHYLADLFDKPPELEEALELVIDSKHFDLNDNDRLQLKDLRITKLGKFTDEEAKQISYSMVDVLFAMVFDLRITDLEHNVCSDQQIGRLAPTLSCLVRYSAAKESLVAAIRRSLCCPLYRNFELAKLAARDVGAILRRGRSSILHCFLHLRSRFNNSTFDFVYLYNQLFIDDYCIWIQSVDDRVLDELAKDVEAVVEDLKHSDIDGLDLDYVETEGRMLKLAVETGEYDSDD
ncbi:Protein SHQ1-like protein [Aphelenchoides besseyi]|nr:Protein SHQ1-like protein [Aphelenchoides besseyi]KAI6224806.1 Protein SHQ1-like protein [Aphelenchoides besseyi]